MCIHVVLFKIDFKIEIILRNYINTTICIITPLPYPGWMGIIA